MPPVDYSDGGRAELVEPPADLTPAPAQAYWRTWAPHACDERTLTPSTAAGFRELCQQAAYLQMLAKRIEHLGPDTKEAAAYWKPYTSLAQRVDSSLARFKLTAFGKPAAAEQKKAAVNPFAQLG